MLIFTKEDCVLIKYSWSILGFVVRYDILIQELK